MMQLQLFGGLALFALVLWQLATGLRWINLGRKRIVIHRATGIALVVVGIPHLINGLRLAGVLPF